MTTTYQCESCGGELELAPDGLSGKCRYCRSVFYFRAEKSEALTMALNRAGEKRRRCDFDGAMDEYEVILKQTAEDAEAHWGMVLSTYGIEYIEDPRTGIMTPTCRRTVMRSILEDEHYLKAVAYASGEQKPIYEKKAAVIDRLQKKIKRQVEEEEDYDVFLSFKSTDENGFPTKDRSIARNIYDALTARGIRTFYSEVTLADRIGEDYEPIIYKALYSSKCFILVATQEAYVDAVWVKNEWSRFRDRIRDEGLRGAAFAVFDGISPMALPVFLQKQGIDLAKYPAGGYGEQIADNLARKWGLAPKEESAEARRLRRELEEQQHRMEEQQQRQRDLEQKLNDIASAPAQQSGVGGVSTRNLISRAKLFLEDKDWKNANQQAEMALNIDAHCAEAYLVELLCLLQLTDAEQLQSYPKPFDEQTAYKRAVQFADEELKAYLTECATSARREETYLVAEKLFRNAKDANGYQQAAEQYAKIPGYKDADQKCETARTYMNKYPLYQKACDMLKKATSETQYREVAELLASLGDYQDAATLRQNAVLQAQMEHAKQARYADLCRTELKNVRTSTECYAIIQGLQARGVDPNIVAVLEEAKKTFETLRRQENMYFTDKLICKILKLKRIPQGWRITGVKAKDLREYNGGCIVIPPYVKGRPVVEIGDYAFKDPKKDVRNDLLAITIPYRVTSIGDYAFIKCSSLTSIYIPMNVTSIGASALPARCYGDGLTHIEVAEENTVYHSAGNCLIETGTKTLIYGCETSVIPADGSVTSIGADAFYGCTGLTSVTIPDGVKTIGDDAFRSTGLTSVTIPGSVETIESGAFNFCKNLTSVSFAQNSRLKCIENWAFHCCERLASITIPCGVESIGEYAFEECKNLTTVNFAQNSRLKNIGHHAFHCCERLTSITIPYGVEWIGYATFGGCTNLASAVFKNTLGWRCKLDYQGETVMTVTSPSANAKNLTDSYAWRDWQRKR